MFYCEVPAGQFIFKQGEPASTYFIINVGSTEVIIHDQVRRVLKAGEGFGELALLFNAERSASVRAVEKCGLWGIDRRTFRKVVQEMMSKQYKENRKFMEKIKFFRKILMGLGGFYLNFPRITHRTSKGLHRHGVHPAEVQEGRIHSSRRRPGLFLLCDKRRKFLLKSNFFPIFLLKIGHGLNS